MQDQSEHHLTAEEYERLSAFVDQHSSPDERHELAAHLEQCATCRRELAALRQLQTLLRQLPAPALPRSFVLPLDTPAPLASAPQPAETTHAPSRAGVARDPILAFGDQGTDAGRNEFRKGGRRGRRQDIVRWVQRFGAVAAMLGLVLLVSGLVTLPRSGGSTARSAPVNRPSGGGAKRTSANSAAHLAPTSAGTPTIQQSNASSQHQSTPGAQPPKGHAAPAVTPPGASAPHSGVASPANPPSTNTGAGTHSPLTPAPAQQFSLPTWLNRLTLGMALLVIGIIALLSASVLRRRGPPEMRFR